MKQNILKNKGQKLKLTTLGFTLIELLAVIVTLAIIALIATPIVLNIISDSKEESNKISIEMYAKAVENAVAKYQLDGKKLDVNKLETTDGRNFSNIDDFKVDYEGNVVCEIIEIYVDGSVYLDKCKVNGEKIEYKFGDDKSYDDGQVVYFDVYNGVVCTETDYHKDNSRSGYNGIFKGENSKKTTDNQNGCLKFYAFLDDGSDKLNLLLDHNTKTAQVFWNISGSTEEGPSDVLTQLETDTFEWKGTEQPKNYEYKGIKNSYEVNYNGYNARLITAQEIAKITGADKEENLNWKAQTLTINDYYLDGAEGTDPTWQTKIADSLNKSKFFWLFDNTWNCTDYGCLNDTSATAYAYGYWTSTSSNSERAYVISYQGKLSTSDIYYASGYNGVRPVIEVFKYKLK